MSLSRSVTGQFRRRALDSYDTAVILNQQSLDKFERKVKPGGTLIYDPYGIHHAPTRTDINVYSVNAMDATIEMGNSKTYNMVLLGALLKIRPVVPLMPSCVASRRRFGTASPPVAIKPEGH